MQNSKFPITLIIHREGEMAYFSQLDLLLTLKRALRRTNLPNYFTRGFRPHIKISFKGALKLGEEGEIAATFYFRRNISEREAADKLNSQLPEGLWVKLDLSG